MLRNKLLSCLPLSSTVLGLTQALLLVHSSPVILCFYVYFGALRFSFTDRMDCDLGQWPDRHCVLTWVLTCPCPAGGLPESGQPPEALCPLQQLLCPVQQCSQCLCQPLVWRFSLPYCSMKTNSCYWLHGTLMATYHTVECLHLSNCEISLFMGKK